MSLDIIADLLQSYCDVGHNKIWRESEIKKLMDQKTNKTILCGPTNALINTYLANADDEPSQYIGEQLMELYDYADEYLLLLQMTISETIEKNREILMAEKKRIKETVDFRAKHNITTINDNYKKREKRIMININKLPEFVVLHIKSYLLPRTILCSITIPSNMIKEMLLPLKLDNVKKVYRRIRMKTTQIEHKLFIIAKYDIILNDDLDILRANNPGTQKQGLVDRICEICNCYNKILNILTKLKKSTNNKTRPTPIPTRTEYCIEATQMLITELTYIYKLIKYSTKPELNMRAKPRQHKQNQLIKA